MKYILVAIVIIVGLSAAGLLILSGFDPKYKTIRTENSLLPQGLDEQGRATSTKIQP